MSAYIVVWLFYFMSVPALLFPVFYTILAPWWTHEMGRHVMAFSSAIALNILMILLYRAFGYFPGFDVVRIVAYGFLALVIWHRLYLLLKIQLFRKLTPPPSRETGDRTHE